MTLLKTDYDDLKDRMARAVGKESIHVDKLREDVRSLRIRKLDNRPCRTIAPIATDGGENHLSLEPLNIEILRVVDSRGHKCVEEIIAVSEDASIFKSMSEQLSVMQKLMQLLSVDFESLSYFLSSAGGDSESISGSKGRIKAFRDILEWAVLLDLATQDWPEDVLLLRDGLLRSKSFKRETFPKLDKAFREIFESQLASDNRKVFILGVAKTSAVLSKLGLAILLEGVFERPYPCYAEVPENLEAKCYNFQKTWLETASSEKSESGQLYQNFGRLHLVKLGKSPDSPIFPVDVPTWLPPNRKQEVLEYLVDDAQDTFPIPGYPGALQRAHDNAVLTGLEIEVLGGLMADALREHVDDSLGEKVSRHLHLGRGLIKGGRRND